MAGEKKAEEEERVLISEDSPSSIELSASLLVGVEVTRESTLYR